MAVAARNGRVGTGREGHFRPRDRRTATGVGHRALHRARWPRYRTNVVASQHLGIGCPGKRAATGHVETASACATIIRHDVVRQGAPTVASQIVDLPRVHYGPGVTIEAVLEQQLSVGGRDIGHAPVGIIGIGDRRPTITSRIVLVATRRDGGASSVPAGTDDYSLGSTAALP